MKKILIITLILASYCYCEIASAQSEHYIFDRDGVAAIIKKWQAHAGIEVISGINGATLKFHLRKFSTEINNIWIVDTTNGGIRIKTKTAGTTAGTQEAFYFFTEKWGIRKMYDSDDSVVIRENLY